MVFASFPTYLLGIFLLFTSAIWAMESRTASFIYLQGHHPEVATNTKGFSLASLDVASFGEDEQAWGDLAEDILAMDTDIVCLRGTSIEQGAFMLYSGLQDRYAHVYLETDVDQGLLVVSRYPMDDARFDPFVDDHQSLISLFDFFETPVFQDETLADEYILQTLNCADWLPYEGVVASVVKRGENVFKVFSEWDAEDLSGILCLDPPPVDWKIYGKTDTDNGARLGGSLSTSGETDRGNKYSAGVKGQVQQDNKGKVKAEAEIYIEGTFQPQSGGGKSR